MNLDGTNFPKINLARQTSRKGITILKETVENDLNWLFRETHLEDDFGIDGHLDIISNEGKVTGKSIAFQLKTGESYFKEKNEIGYIYRGENKHLNYYLNYSVPIIIILVNPISRKIVWELFDAAKTDKVSNSWKMTIPKNKTLAKNSKAELLKFVGPITDYSSQLEEEWKINGLLKKYKRILFTVPKEEIHAENYQFILDGLNRIQTTSDLIIHLKNKVDISFDDYDSDKRELFEIPEVKSWILELYNKSDCWPYLFAMDKGSGFMKLAFFCHLSDYTKHTFPNGAYKVDYNPDDMKAFIVKLFLKLNSYCKKKSIDLKVNKEITNKILKYYTEGKVSLD